MSKTIQEMTFDTASAVQEYVGGGPTVWVWKMAGAAVAAGAHGAEAAAIVIGGWFFLVLTDTLLGVLLAIRKAGLSVIKPGRLVSGPAAKFLVGGMVLLAGSIFDVAVFGSDPDAWLQGTALKVVAGVVLFSILLQVADKADVILGFGIGERLRAWGGQRSNP